VSVDLRAHLTETHRAAREFLAGQDRVQQDLHRIAATLGMYRFAIAREDDLQQAIAEALEKAGHAHPYRVTSVFSAEREVVLDDRSRIDLLTVGGIGIEVKTQGRVGPVRQQCERYLASPQVRGLLLVTAVSQHRVIKSTVQSPKPFEVLSLRTGLW
jgi:hypothetical protein